MAFSSYTFQKTEIAEQVAAAVRAGLTARPKRLPPWLFYDEVGSRLFERITELEEYYLTRTERGIFLDFADEIVGRAAGGRPLRVTELGAGSAEKTRLLLAAAVARQGEVVYEPVDVSASALAAAKERIERELPGVTVTPRVMDYTRGLELDAEDGERRLVLYIGSSMGNFEPEDAAVLLKGVRAGLRAGDGLLLGVDLVKEEATLLAAYDDAAGVTAAFNRNLLVRLNQELDADFEPEAFAHRALWNAERRRMEMYLESRARQTVRVEALELRVEFERGERMHTENSYKYLPGEAEAMLEAAGFTRAGSWTDERGWFAVCLGRA
ncbi:MAG TPA: L-histidine N(alpha)-methyltransferase [Terracidiphilus sp.]|nr:L-histidine N(alpha)-methyltransferase [Terracidiphilus sp.]